jgi:RNA polymerase sigma-70 factor (ECF subfamily)
LCAILMIKTHKDLEPDKDCGLPASGAQGACGVAQVDDRALVERVAAGDAAAVREMFVERHGRSLSYLANRLGCEDLTNALLVYLAEDDWRRLRTWDGRCTFGYWLELVAVRFFLRHMKDERASAPLPVYELASDRDGEPGAELLRKERRAELLEALNKLPDDRERLAILLHYFDGLPLNEVARELHVSVANLYVIKHRALRRLRGILDGRGTDDQL